MQEAQMGQRIPLLSQEGWREAPGWFQSRNPEGCRLGTTPRRIRYAIPLPSSLRRAFYPIHYVFNLTVTLSFSIAHFA
jgi:hypothetical protein